MKDPAFLFYSSDFLTGVSDLTFEERGQYITLLCLQHQKGRLSKKAVAIAVPNAAADVLAKFKVDESDCYYNERLEHEAEKRAQHSEKQRQRAIDGWRKRKKETSRGNATADATALPLENEDENRNEYKKKGGFQVPKVSEVKDYCRERSNSVDAQNFVDFYTAKGWYVGKNKMKDWKAAVRTWEKTSKDKQSATPQYDKL